jgi:hypothetical protein
MNKKQQVYTDAHRAPKLISFVLRVQLLLLLLMKRLSLVLACCIVAHDCMLQCMSHTGTNAKLALHDSHTPLSYSATSVLNLNRLSALSRCMHA